LLPDGTCNQLIPGCGTTNSNGTCTSCVKGWVFDSSNNCVQLLPGCATGDLSGACTSCLPGYYQATSGDCELLPSNCIKTDNDGLCTLCNDGYELIQNTRECAVVAPQTTQVTGANMDCRLMDSSGKCTSCRKNYNFSNGGCTPNGANPKC
jgi:hypothetical protein